MKNVDIEEKEKEASGRSESPYIYLLNSIVCYNALEARHVCYFKIDCRNDSSRSNQLVSIHMPCLHATVFAPALASFQAFGLLTTISLDIQLHPLTNR